MADIAGSWCDEPDCDHDGSDRCRMRCTSCSVTLPDHDPACPVPMIAGARPAGEHSG